MTGPPGRAAVEAACRALLTADITSVCRLASSTNAAVYRVTLAPPQTSQVIVKLYAGRARWKAIKEHRLLTTLAKCPTVNVPQVMVSGTVPDLHVTVLIMRDLGSATLRKVTGSGVCSRDKALSLLGRLLRSFHRLPYPPPGPGMPLAALDIAAQITALRQHLPDELRTVTQAPLERVIALSHIRQPVWCHGDLHADNVLLCAQEGDLVPYLIDFEQSTIATAEYDLAQTLVTFDVLDHDDQARLLAAYGIGLSENLLADLITFHALRGWRWAALRENRDVALWQARLRFALNQ